MSKKLQITVTPGPLKISGESVSIRYCGNAVPAEGDVYLCRCGQSANAPFCDGSHNRVGFVAEPGVGKTRDVQVWEGNTIRTFFNPNVCMHVFKCQSLKALRDAELDGDADAAKQIAEVVMACPSGALTYESKTVNAQAVHDVDIDIMEGGEIRVQCAFEINAELGERQPHDRGTLCRCGLSQNKPWCDGRHKKREGFR